MKREGRNEYHGYEYFTEDQLTATLRPKLAQHNLIVTTDVKTVETKEITNSKGKTEQLVTVTTQHIIRDGDTGEHITCSSAGMGVDPLDKGIYKAITGAMKYFLMKLFFISDQADPEAGSGSDREEKQTKQQDKHRSTRRQDKHRSTRRYEEETSKGNKASVADLDTLRTFLKTKEITEAFVMKLVKEGKLDEKAGSLDDLKPGVLTKLLTLRKRIETRWGLEDKGVDKSNRRMGEPKVGTRGSKQARDEADEDQTRQEERTFIMANDMTPQDYLEQEGKNWGEVEIHFGSKKGTALGEMEPDDVGWWVNNWTPKKFKGKFSEGDILLDAALCCAQSELIEG